jgi:hypothetical protein
MQTAYLSAHIISTAQDPKRDIESELLARLGVEAEVRFIQPQFQPNRPAKPLNLRRAAPVGPSVALGWL